MKLHSPQFESRLRSGVRQIIRQDSQLKRQLSLAPREPWMRRTSARVVFRIFLALALGVGVCALAGASLPRTTQAAVGALWFLGSALIFRARVINIFYRLDWLAAFLVLPAAPELVVRWNWNQVIRMSWRTGLDALAILAGMAFSNDAGTAGWLAVIPFAALLTTAIQTLGLWLVFVPFPAILNLLPGCVIMGGVVVLNVPSLRQWLLQFLADNSETIAIILPGGWVLLPFLACVQAAKPILATLLLPAVGLATSCVLARQRLNANYSPFDVALWQVFHVPPAEMSEEFNQFLANRPSPPGKTEITDALQSREFLTPAIALSKWRWIERRWLAWLTPRERTIAEVAYFSIPQWTRMAIIASILFAASIVTAAIAKRAADAHLVSTTPWISGACCVVGCLLGLPLATGFKRATWLINVGGISIPFAALFPVSMNEFLRLAWKVNIMRGAFILPIMAVGGALFGVTGTISPAIGALTGIKLVVFSIGFTPIGQAMAFSSQSNDTSRLTLRSVLALGSLGGGTIGSAGLGMASLFVPPAWSIVCLALAIVVSATAGAVYRGLYSRRSFDLMVKPKS